jgi:hypothetical protein
MKTFLINAFLVLSNFIAIAQCNFDPTVTPANLILCPDAKDTLWTQTYDSVQWLKDGNIIPGANNDYYVVDQYLDAGSQFSVSATDSGCTETSPEVLVDGYVFLLPFVQTSGNFTIGTNGETIICLNDTAWFELMPPYETNITWFNNGSPIAGADSSILFLTTSGNYTVQGAPAVCPDFIQQLGLTLEVDFINCGTGINDSDNDPSDFYFDPVNRKLIIKTELEKKRVSLYSAGGMLLIEGNSNEVDLTGLANGIYFVRFSKDKQVSIRKFAIF